MTRLNHPVEKPVRTLVYKGVEFEVVERPDVIWVGCVDYAQGNSGESDIGETLKRFQELVNNGIVPENKINPDWSAALSINYTRDDAPCGILFGNECYPSEQDERFDVFTQPGGLWLRVRNDKKAKKFFKREKWFKKKVCEPYKLFAGESAPLQCAARANGYIQNPDVHIQVEYHCHAEYSKRYHSNYAYIPIIEKE
jgi:hypothetical protein